MRTGPHDLERVEVRYQPIVDLATGEVAGVEALARWRDPSGTLHLPADFLGVAEQTDLVGEIGMTVRTLAAAQVARWSDEHARPLALHVNVSARELDGRLVTSVEQVLHASGLAPGQLVLEVTGSQPIEDVPAAATISQLLRACGARIALDDFGMGWASFDRLHALDAELVKVDRPTGSRDARATRSLTTAIVAFAHRRGLTVVGTDIERPEHARRLRELGCGLGQGHLFSPATTASGISLRLASGFGTVDAAGAPAAACATDYPDTIDSGVVSRDARKAGRRVGAS